MNIFLTTSLNIQQFLSMDMVRMAQVVEYKAGYPKVQDSLLAFHILELFVYTGHGLLLIKKFV